MTEDQLQQAVRISDKMTALTAQLENINERENFARGESKDIATSDIVQALQWVDRDADGKRESIISPSLIREIRAMIKSDLLQQMDSARTKFAAL